MKEGKDIFAIMGQVESRKDSLSGIKVFLI